MSWGALAALAEARKFKIVAVHSGWLHLRLAACLVAPVQTDFGQEPLKFICFRKAALACLCELLLLRYRRQLDFLPLLHDLPWNAFMQGSVVDDALEDLRGRHFAGGRFLLDLLELSLIDLFLRSDFLESEAG